MSEELLQTLPQKIGKYTYYRLGNTTLEQLKNTGIIPKANYGHVRTKKPDGLVLYHGTVKAVVEYKQPKSLQTDEDLATAISQEIDVAKALCKMLIITDATKSIWVNALNGEHIKDAFGNEIRTIFHPFSVKHVATIEYLLSEIDASISDCISHIKSAKLIDPTPLATRLWQTIWVATGKSPVKCLYNVVELFIFKFLSDLEILPDDIAFGNIRNKALADPEDALEFYAKNTRSKIYKLFPHGKDGTTIINGTIFVTESGEPNLSQAILFSRCLDHLHRYGEEFGSLTKIDKQFKTKLYESFLKQEAEALGQYFTPRRLIQSIIRMTGIDEPDFQFGGKRFCDPFCGVGGFPLEILNLNEGMHACYAPDNNKKITLPFVMHGFDKGFERDDERTIIMAKANMLIYLAELLFANPECATEFARIFNETFVLFKDNLGTFGHIIKSEDEKYDYILSNPPYVTSGSSIIKEEIRKTPRTINEYPVNALGLEGLSLEWIIKSLRAGGKAFLVIPDGILARTGGKKLRSHILSECFLDAVVSLPLRTFYANSKHTYILAITKKHNRDDIQVDPVFTYLVSNIGERLTSVKRDEIDDDDLPEMEAFFGLFSGARGSSRELLEKESLRCKIQDINRFRDSHHWVIDRWWTREERITLHIEESPDVVEKKDIDALLLELNASLSNYEQTKVSRESEAHMKKVALSNKSLFRMLIGKRVLKKDLLTGGQGGGIPVYSANVFEPVGLIPESNIGDFTLPAILWGIDGNFDLRYMPKEEAFATTDHCGTIQILEATILPEYLLYALTCRKQEESFDRSFRASLANMNRLAVLVPVRDDGSFDVDAQRQIADSFLVAQQKQSTLRELKTKIDEWLSHYLAIPKLG
jgi:type I restriction enzyme M protein